MNEEELIKSIVTEVLKRLLPNLGANGSQGTLIAVFTGATVGMDKAVEQVRSLIMRGFRVRLVFSQMAEHLYGNWTRDQLAGFPQWDQLPDFTWLHALQDANGIIVPMLSVNTLSKLAQLIADNQTSNLILHGLFTGKPVFLAKDGVDQNEGRIKLGFNNGNSFLLHAVEDRLNKAKEYGCIVVNIDQLTSKVSSIFSVKKHKLERTQQISSKEIGLNTVRAVLKTTNKVITGGDVREAHRRGADLKCSSSAIITPLARDTAAKLGIHILRDEF